MTATRGFTLIEVLVAILILSIMAVVAYRGLSVVLDTQRRVTEVNDTWRAYVLAFTQIGMDVGAAAPFPSSDGMRQQPPMLGSATPDGADGAQLSMTVMGDPDHPSARNDLRRVGYRLRNGRLEYMLWPDRNGGVQTPRVVTLMDGVERAQFRYMDDNDTWQAAWPTAAGQSGLPRGLEVTLQVKGKAPITRVYALP